jgi:hypothetical protein
VALTRDAVVWGFRLILGREPESEEGILSHMALADEAALVETLLRSQEFRVSGRFARTVQLRSDATAQRPPPPAYDSRAALKVAVFGNCQAAGIGSLLQALTGDCAVRTYETTPGFLEKLRKGEFDIAAAVGPMDLVWVQMVGEVTQAIKARAPRHSKKVRQLPPLNYSGFHPDCVYIGRGAGGYLQGPMGEYQSSLAYWAWREGLDIEQAMSLYSDEVFDHLKFHDYHAAAQKALVAHGRTTGLHLAEMIDRWRAEGCFMHTVNHPKVHALGDLVAAALAREGIEPIPGAARWVEDRLARWPVWPVYPSIARSSGLGGDYVFKLDRGFCPDDKPVLTMGLEAFLKASFANFRRVGELRCDRADSQPYQELRRFVRERPSRLSRLTDAIGRKLAPLRRQDAQPVASENPYADLPDHRFWRRAVERVSSTELDPVVRTGFTIDRATRVATAGSCFAQHIARKLRSEGFNYVVADAVKGMSAQESHRRGFGVYSARYGNLYTVRQLLQLFDRAHGDLKPLDRAWKREDGRYADPFRPQIEPDGFASVAEVEAATTAHLADVRRLFVSHDVFVFTLGLTEAWRRREDGAVFPLAPGVVAGRFDPALHEFVNFSAEEVLDDLRAFIRRLQGVNPSARVILTVSPVPLIATYEDCHVLVSTVHSKSVLRAAAGRLAAEVSCVDYFPSYEIVTSPASRGAYFEDDLRSVTEAGVAHVMRVFLRHYAGLASDASGQTSSAGPGVTLEAAASSAPPAGGQPSPALAEIEREQRAWDAIVCDEEALDRHRAS